MRVALPQVKQTGVKKGGSMDDLISREKAIEAIDKVFPEDPNKSECASGVAIGAALASIYVKELPSADLSEYSDKLWRNAYERGKVEAQAEIVRCKDCKYNSNTCGNYVNCDIIPQMFGRTVDNFCSRAERRTDDR
jgi:hypothetical protein